MLMNWLSQGRVVALILAFVNFSHVSIPIGATFNLLKGQACKNPTYFTIVSQYQLTPAVTGLASISTSRK